MGRRPPDEFKEYFPKIMFLIKDCFEDVLIGHEMGEHKLAAKIAFYIVDECNRLDKQYPQASSYGVRQQRDKTISKADREYTIKKYKRRCAYCGKPGDRTKGPDGVTWQIDHIIPYSWGGAHVRDNFALSCRKCNVKKFNHWWFPNA